GGALVQRLAHAAGRDQVRPVLAVPARAAAHVRDLDHDPGAVPVHGPAQGGEVRDHLVTGQVDRRPPRLRTVDGDRAGAAAHGHADAAFGLLLVVEAVA